MNIHYENIDLDKVFFFQMTKEMNLEKDKRIYLKISCLLKIENT